MKPTILFPFLGILFLIFLMGCNGHHCISVGGSYQGIDGNLEYCFDAAKSAEVGVPVLTSPTQEESVILSMEEVDKLLGVDVKTMSESVWKRLNKRLKR